MRSFSPSKLIPEFVRRALRGCFTVSGHESAVSTGYQTLEGAIPSSLLRGFAAPIVAERQHRAFEPVLRQLREGDAREDFLALAAAVRRTGLQDPTIVEVGCGSGWNQEVLVRLLGRPVRYIGVDYAPAMTELGRRAYPGTPFVVGDAMSLPFRSGAVDVLLSGTVLMHLWGYRAAIEESRRVTKRWCIFHTVPVLIRRASVFLKKEAYGQPTIEVVLNESELLDLFDRNSLIVRDVIDSLPYDLAAVVGERTVTKTYLCERQP